MPRKQFYYHEKGNHSETWFYLARDVEGRAVVEQEFSAGMGSKDMEIGAPTQISVKDFLAGSNFSAQEKLLKLIGTLLD